MPRDDDLRIEMVGGTTRTFLKQLLGIWAIGYVILSILPLFANGGNLTGGIVSLFVAGMLFWPWIVGIIILGVLVLVSPAPTPVIRRGPTVQRPDLLHGTPIWARGRSDAEPEHGKIGPLHWDKDLRRWVP